MDDDGSTIKAYGRGALGVARCRSFSLSLSLFFSRLLWFLFVLLSLSFRRAKLITRASSSRRIGKQETRKKRGERRETFERLIIRGSTAQTTFTNAVISVHCYRCLPWDYTGVNIQGVLLFASASDREDSSCGKQRELNFSSIRSRVKSNLESV